MALATGVDVPREGDWRAWMKDLGDRARRMRELLGLSQDQLARYAGVSQGAVSRLEGGRGLATPMLVILKINLAFRRALLDVDPALLNDDLRRALEIEQRLSPPVGGVGFNALPLTKDPVLEQIVLLYRSLPERQRDTFLSVVRAAAEALAGTTPKRGQESS